VTIDYRPAINCDHLQTVSKLELGPEIASLRHDRLEEVRAAVLLALGFGP
jgi:mRNA-degrading endonuclease toxin of MazEF toxin-antitoxin module